jgi:hypothetical protein
MERDRGATQRWSQVLDELERVLVEELGVRSALARARELLDGATLEAARAELDAARVAHREVDEGTHGTLLEILERARERETRAKDELELVEGWHACDRAEARLAVDLFVGARALGPAGDPAWLPGGAVSPRPAASASSPIYLRSPQLRICSHFEPDVDLLVHDPALGTLAMVQVVDADTSEAIQAQVRAYVDRATYLRHLLLTARDEQPNGDRQIVGVELVLVHCERDLDGDGQVDVLYEVGEILRQLGQRTDFLHAIGVNVLAAGEGGFERAELRRAFSWLLHDTQGWFAALEARPRQTGDELRESFGRLREIILDEYRLPGRRGLTLDPRARLHLLHGHNGSGKSSLVEALELMITGSIERLAGIEDYEHVVRNRWAEGPATITLVGDGPEAEPLRFELHGSERPPQPLSPGSRAASFRLDQTVMDRLARASDVDRAAELLAAFFADEAKVRERWREATAEAEAVLARLPARVRRWLEAHRRERQDLHEVAVEELACLGEDKVSASLVDALLPLPRVQLRPLLGQLDALATLEAQLERDGWVAADTPLWEALESAFERLSGDLPERVRIVESVLRTLDRLERWWQEGEGGGFDSEAAYAEALDEWLELSALVEIAEQQDRVLATLGAARAEGWDPARLDEAGAAGELLRELAELEPAVREDLERARSHWARRREQLGHALRRSSEGGGEAKPVAATRVRLDDEEVEELDRFGEWWSPDESGPGLGARIRGSIEAGEVHSFAHAAIGTQAWAVPIHTAAAQMLGPLRELRDAWSASQPARGVEARAVETESEVAQRAWEPPLEQGIAERPEVEPIALGDAPLEHEGWMDLDDDEDVGDVEEVEEVEEIETTEEAEDARDKALSRKQKRKRRLGGEPPPAASPPRPATPQSRRQSLAPPVAPVARPKGAPSSPPVAVPRPSVASMPKAVRTPEPTVEREPAPTPEPEPEPAPTPEAPAEVAPPEPRPKLAPELASGASSSLSALIERLRQAHEVSHRAHEVGAEVQDSFVMRLAANDERALGLIDALNELMALFTPARWAYEDVVLRYQESDRVSRLRFETGELRGGADPHARARADLRLNTAQLNAFTVALFLLCAPRVDNPLGLLVLDDPLQNMDELTVTTLARGLAKLLRVLPARWSLMMLFHGEGDLARFHDELECGVYFLPWLSPTVRGQQADIRCQDEDSRLSLAVQRIDGLVTLRPG